MKTQPTVEETAALVDFALSHPKARLANRRIMLEAARRAGSYIDPNSELCRLNLLLWDSFS